MLFPSMFRLGLIYHQGGKVEEHFIYIYIYV